MVSGAPSVGDTLVLENRSLVSGNFLPSNGAGPIDAAVDTSSGVLWVTDGNSNLVTLVDLSTGGVLRSIAVGTYPEGIAFDPTNGDLYVANYGSNNVTVINGQTDTTTASVPVGTGPVDVALDRGDLWVTNFGSSTVSDINTTTGAVTHTVATGSSPYGLAVDAGASKIFVALETAPSTVQVLSTLNYTMSTSISALGIFSVGAAFDPVNGDVYVANEGGNLTVLSASSDSVVGTIPMTSSLYSPYWPVYDPSDNTLYVADNYPSNVTVVNPSTNTVMENLDTGSMTTDLVIAPTSGDLYAINAGSDNLSIISPSTQKVTGSIRLGSAPEGIAVDAALGDLCVVDQASDQVDVVDPTTGAIVSTVPVGTYPYADVMDSSTGDLFVSNQFSRTVSVIDVSTAQVVDTIPIGGTPGYGVFDPATGAVYFTDESYGTLHVINGASLALSTYSLLSTGSGTTSFGGGIALDSSNGLLYVATGAVTYSGTQFWNVTVFNPSSDTVGATISIGAELLGMAFDPLSGDLFAANPANDLVTIVDPSTDTTVGSVPTPSSPEDVTDDPAHGLLYVSDLLGASVTSFNGTSRLTYPAVAVGANPNFLIYDPAEQTVYVSNWVSGSLSFLGPELTGASVSPSPATLRVSSTLTLTASPVCSGGPCAGGTSYAWSLSNSLGSLSTTSGPSVTFTAGATAGTALVFVNATWNGATVSSGPVAISITTGSVPTLTSVLVSPRNFSMAVGGTQLLTATPSCSTTCPSGTAYTWQVGTPSVGSVSPTTGPSTTFTALGAGTVVVTVTASLNGVTVSGTGTISVQASGVLSVSLLPGTATLTSGGSQTFTATSTCAGGSCPAQLVYAWSLNTSSLGTLSASTGSTTTFTSGSSSGWVLLTVVASLAGTQASASVPIQVRASPAPIPSPFSLFGLSQMESYLLVLLLVVLVIVAMAGAAVSRRRKRARMTAASSPRASSTPPGAVPVLIASPGTTAGAGPSPGAYVIPIVMAPYQAPQPASIPAPTGPAASAPIGGPGAPGAAPPTVPPYTGAAATSVPPTGSVPSPEPRPAPVTESMVRCEHCGTMVTASALTCSKCGTPMSGVDPTRTLDV